MSKGEEEGKKKKSSVISAAESIRARFGRSIEPVGKKILETPKAISTGSILLDQAIGDCKGWPEGSCIEIFGWEGAGKTLMMYLAMAEAQKTHPDRPCVLIDAEKQFQFQAKWAQKVGVDVEKLIVLQWSSAEECFEMIHALIVGEHEADPKTGEILRVINPGNYAIIGVDSVTQLTSETDTIKDLTDSRRIGSQAAAIGLGLKKVTSAMSRSDVNSHTTIMFINQLRANPNSMARNKEYRTGGNALPFYDTVAIKVAKVWDSQVRDDNGEIISHDVKVTFAKNKAGSMPEEAIVFTLRHDGTGVDNEGELFDVAMVNGLITGEEVVKKNGKSTMRYNFIPEMGLSDKYADFGKIKFKTIIEENPQIEAQIRQLIKDGKFFVNKDSVKETIPDSSVDKKEQGPSHNASSEDDDAFGVVATTKKSRRNAED